MNVRTKTNEFVKVHGGSIVGELQGQKGAIAYKVAQDKKIFHIYYSREWYHKYNGISIPDHALDLGLKENAIIVMYVENDYFWQYATEWLRLSRIIKNKMYGGTMENLIKKEDLLTGDFTQKPKSGMDGFL